MRLALVLSLLLACAPAHAELPIVVRPEFPKVAIVVGDMTDEDAIQPILDAVDNNAGKDKSILLRIDSHGGSVEAGWHLIQHLEDVAKGGTTIECAVDTEAISMAFVLLQSDACSKRYSTDRSMFLAHLASLHGVDGTEEDLNGSLERLRILDHGLLSTMAKRMKMDEAALKAKVTGKGWNMNAEEALAANAIDMIVEPKELPAAVPLDKSPKKKSLLELLGL